MTTISEMVMELNAARKAGWVLEAEYAEARRQLQEWWNRRLAAGLDPNGPVDPEVL